MSWISMCNFLSAGNLSSSLEKQPPIRKGTLTFGIYHRPFPTGQQIADVRAFNTAGIHRQHGQCRASARPEEERFLFPSLS